MLETRPSRRGVDDTRIVPFFGAEFSRVVIAARSLLLEQIIPDRSVTFPYNLQKKFPAPFSGAIRQIFDFGRLKHIPHPKSSFKC